MFCPNCGTQVPENDNYCPTCGEPVFLKKRTPEENDRTAMFDPEDAGRNNILYAFKIA